MINTKEAKPERMVTMDNKSKLLDCLYKDMIAYFAVLYFFFRIPFFAGYAGWEYIGTHL